ncbi:MAG: transcriptional regulator, partial [Alphaproteobacteria bacterium]|nr:transcriptional regulator [Alphaproteobacteria bacterium]
AAPPAEAPPAVAEALQPALASARAAGGSVAAAAAALADLLPAITWYARQGEETVCENFADRHALATLIGSADRPGVLEARDDVRVGISLVVPETPYPDHRHPPEELYLALTPGAWRQDLGPWFEPGPGGVVFNTSNILHGMRAGASPQLALWCLPS